MTLSIINEISDAIVNITNLINNFRMIINMVFNMIPDPFGGILKWASIIIIAIIIVHIVRG